jgi:hypothetical protein
MNRIGFAELYYNLIILKYQPRINGFREQLDRYNFIPHNLRYKFQAGKYRSDLNLLLIFSISFQIIKIKFIFNPV